MPDIERVYDALSLELKRPLRVLDLGCAQGFFSFNIAHKGGVTCVDLRPENVNLCNILADENPECKVQFVQAKIEDFVDTVQEGEYDLVLMLSVLHNMSKYLGIERVQDMVAYLSKKIPNGIFEFALESVHAKYIPKNYRDFLPGFSFIRTLSYSDSRDVGGVKRPLCFASSRYAYFENLGMMKIDDITYNVHRTYNVHSGLNKKDVMHFHCGDKFVKFFNVKNQDLLLKSQQEVQFLKDLGGQRGLPKLYAVNVEQDITGLRIFIVRDRVKGITLSDKIASRTPINRWDVVKQTLEWLVFFEQHNYYHGDCGTNNFIYSDDGKIYPIDYEEIRHERIVLAWPHNVIMLFFIFMNSVLDPSYKKFAFQREVRLSTEFKKYISQEQYDKILELQDSDKYFSQLYEILFTQKNSKTSYTTNELEILEIEKYLGHVGERLQEYKNYFEQIKNNFNQIKILTLMVLEQREKINQLEKIVNEKIIN